MIGSPYFSLNLVEVVGVGIVAYYLAVAALAAIGFSDLYAEEISASYQFLLRRYLECNFPAVLFATVLGMLRANPQSLPLWVTVVALTSVVVTCLFALGNLFSAATGKCGVRFGDIIEEE